MGSNNTIAPATQPDLPLWDTEASDPPRESENRPVLPGQSGSSEEPITFQWPVYQYHGLSFTVDEAGVFPSCPLDRIKAMVDATLRDPNRQQEIALFGQRPWHSRVRPERASCQALDYALGHDVELVARYLPHVSHWFQNDPARADAWTMELRRAYRTRDRERARQLLIEAGVPFTKQ
jgi:hypothetical protein